MPKRLLHETPEQKQLLDEIKEFEGIGPSEAYRRAIMLFAEIELDYELHGELRATTKGGKMTREEKIQARMIVGIEKDNKEKDK